MQSHDHIHPLVLFPPMCFVDVVVDFAVDAVTVVMGSDLAFPCQLVHVNLIFLQY